jgi:hypothetical protein
MTKHFIFTFCSAQPTISPLKSTSHKGNKKRQVCKGSCLHFFKAELLVPELQFSFRGNDTDAYFLYSETITYSSENCQYLSRASKRRKDHEERMAISELQVVGSPFRGIHGGVYRGAARINNFGEVMVMLRHIMYPKTGWVILHAIAVIALFLLSYSVHF